jgi:hypothetical protein
MAIYTQGKPSENHSTKKVAPKGDYRMVVLQAEDKMASTGSEMIKMKHGIIGPVGGPDFEDGEHLNVYDNLVFHQNAIWKVDQFRSACGDDVSEGEEVEVLAQDQDGKTFVAHLDIQKDNKGRDQNYVVAYIVPEEGF